MISGVFLCNSMKYMSSLLRLKTNSFTWIMLLSEMDVFCQIQPSHVRIKTKTCLIFMKTQNNTPQFSFFHMNTLSPSWQPSCLSWVEATESIILLQLCCCGCLINDTTNNNCHAVTSVSSPHLAQLGAALCRLPPQIRTPLEKLFTHLSPLRLPFTLFAHQKTPWRTW